MRGSHISDEATRFFDLLREGRLKAKKSREHMSFLSSA